MDFSFKAENKPLRGALLSSQSHRWRKGDDEWRNNLSNVTQPVKFGSQIRILNSESTTQGIWLERRGARIEMGETEEGTLSTA